MVRIHYLPHPAETPSDQLKRGQGAFLFVGSWRCVPMTATGHTELTRRDQASVICLRGQALGWRARSSSQGTHADVAAQAAMRRLKETK